MITKVLLIVYILGGGAAVKSGGTSTYNTNFVFQEFYTMEDCEMVEKEMENLANSWYRGKNKDDTIRAMFSTKCVEITSMSPSADVTLTMPEIPKSDPPKPPPIQVAPTTRKHKRWDQ